MPSSTSKPSRSPPLAGATLPVMPSRGIVVPFVPRVAQRQHLTMRDRMSAASRAAELPLLGYDRLVIHSRLPGDPPELGDLLLIYRTGEPWASWGFARQGDAIMAWCCATGADVGRFGDLDEALAHVLAPPCTLPAGQVPPRRLPAEPIRLFRS